MSVRTYTVLVDNRSGVSVETLADTLEQYGVDVTQQLESIGVIVGRIDENRLDEIRAIPGVAAVEAERKVGPA